VAAKQWWGVICLPFSSSDRLWATFPKGGSGCDPYPVVALPGWLLELALVVSAVCLKGVVWWRVFGRCLIIGICDVVEWAGHRRG
jgi:hypothetical protein